METLEAGDVQIIRAGKGISHAEHVEKGGVIFQIWVDPDLSKTLQQDASYDDYKEEAFQKTVDDGTTTIHYAGEKGLMHLDTPGVDIRRIKMTDDSFEWKGDKSVILSLYVLGGSGMLNEKTIEQDDFIIIDDGMDISIKVHKGGLDVFAFTVPASIGYPTYAQRMMH
jgi:redox-sensitive bicupin YhaK (pirin superfamily)